MSPELRELMRVLARAAMRQKLPPEPQPDQNRREQSKQGATWPQ